MVSLLFLGQDAVKVLAMQFVWSGEAPDALVQVPVAPELNALAQSPVYSPETFVQDFAGQAMPVVVAFTVVVVVVVWVVVDVACLVAVIAVFVVVGALVVVTVVVVVVGALVVVVVGVSLVVVVVGMGVVV
jgi:hypothetical protein